MISQSTNQARSELDLGLSRIHHVLKHLGNPEQSFSTIHVAGTNGKGSVCAILESCLRVSSAFHHIGRFVSPYLIEPRDAVWIDGKPIDKVKWEVILEKVLSSSLLLLTNNCIDKPLTTFELWTIAAFMCFQDASVDIAVIEVGVGGRDDATNVIPTPLVAVITSISMDHVELLGPSIADIATHKSGIIKAPLSTSNKPSIVVVSPYQNEIVLQVIHQQAKMKNAKVIQAQSLLHFKNDANLYDSIIEVRDDNFQFKVPLALLGSFQLANGGTALATLRVIQTYFPSFTDEEIMNGFSKVVWPGRFQKIIVSPPSSMSSSSSSLPLDFILDGGHNEGALPLVRKSIDDLLVSLPQTKNTRFVQFIFSSGASRSLESLLPHLLKPGDSIFAIPFTTPEGMGWVKSHTPETIVTVVNKLFHDSNPPVEAVAFATLDEALTTVFERESLSRYNTDNIDEARIPALRVICGSLYLVSDVYRREQLLGT
jgi:folylpolyglutamate synthase/dihydrofolate synthase